MTAAGNLEIYPGFLSDNFQSHPISRIRVCVWKLQFF